MDVIPLLQNGEIELQGEFLWGSNYTFLVEVRQGTTRLPAVYKPTRGVRPLWDFDDETLAHREAAAYLVSEALGWHLVPPTVHRSQAPLGPGSLQQFIQHDPEHHYFNFTEAERQRLRPVVLFDYLTNNADRKGSHLLIDPNGHLWCIDHGLCFHIEDKLRTVLWDFAGTPIPQDLRADLETLIGNLTPEARLVADLQRHLAPQEIAALRARAQRLAHLERFPIPPQDRRAFPYPPI